ncbi:MAG: NAD(P)/FAD-dependent oxidoreductase [Desulfobacterales bacterium]|nr:NAD(P)/FAD-dependent oxidoreductase [Desulfobacterales bacterium]
MTDTTDVIVIGAGAAGLMCAMQAGRRGRTVRVIDHARRPGRKILMSGGGHCNFTNEDVRAEHYLSHNPHFCKSALSRFSQWDFIELVRRHGIAFSRREHGQLFCDEGSGRILEMLLAECRQAGVALGMETEIEAVSRLGERRFALHTNQGIYECASLVVATGGLSIPGSGASGLGFEIARQFEIQVWPLAPGLVPLTLQPKDKERLADLAGIAVEAAVRCGKKQFRDPLLFTHRGLSGPAILQISLEWQPGQEIGIDLLPELNLAEELEAQRQHHPRRALKSALAERLPKRLAAVMAPPEWADIPLARLSSAQVQQIATGIQQWRLKPGGTEGYRTAEVTLGGVDCDALSSKTMEARAVPGLFFIGEVVDITGRLGGYNLQWAWSSGWCAGQYV